ncbi:hypothetical protein [Actinomadura sp. 6N118]|uniref:hypothetical protein n=1 Tax=Actinomadura sp. 6N118 TaxID=3375151 RepID=UPI00379D523E
MPTITEVIEAGEGRDGQSVIEDAILEVEWGYDEALDDPFERGGRWRVVGCGEALW